MSSVKLYCSRKHLEDLLSGKADFVAARTEKINFDDVPLNTCEKAKSDQDQQLTEDSQEE